MPGTPSGTLMCAIFCKLNLPVIPCKVYRYDSCDENPCKSEQRVPITTERRDEHADEENRRRGDNPADVEAKSCCSASNRKGEQLRYVNRQQSLTDPEKQR